jgi:hypothetical protein
MTATLAKLEDMSLQHWLKEVILPIKWAERVVNNPLTYSPERERFEADITWFPNFMQEGRGWVYFEALATSGTLIPDSPPTTEQTTQVEVRNEVGSVIDPSYYDINYKEGAIIASGGTTTPDGVPTEVDYSQYYVSLLDAWPGVNPPDAPIVAVEMGNYRKEGRQLGGGRKAIRTFIIHIFATSSAERDDLAEWVYDSFFQRHIPVIDYRSGEPLNYDGTFNSNYTGDLLQLDNNDDALFYFDNIRAETININRDEIDDINRFRAKITLIASAYRDGIDFNVL